MKLILAAVEREAEAANAARYRSRDRLASLTADEVDAAFADLIDRVRSDIETGSAVLSVHEERERAGGDAGEADPGTLASTLIAAPGAPSS